MGNRGSWSTTTGTTSKTEEDRAAIARHEQMQRQKALWINGILVPPMFGIPTSSSSTGTTSTTSSSRLIPSIILNTTAASSSNYDMSTTPLLGYVDYLRTQSDLSYRLLHTHLQSGLWITSYTSKNAVRVGIFDSSGTSTTNTSTIATTSTSDSGTNHTNRSDTLSSESSSISDDENDDINNNADKGSPAGTRFQQVNRNSSTIGGQVTLERQFIDDQGRNYGSIQCHTDPTNPVLPYTIQVTHRPIPSLSLFGVFMSSPATPALSLQQTSSSSSSATPSTNGYIGAQINHTIPLSPVHPRSNDRRNFHDTMDTIYDNATSDTAYVARTNPNDADDSAMHCNVGVYIPIHWDNVIDALDSIVPGKNHATKLRKDSHLVPFYYDRNQNSSSSNNRNSKSKQPQSWLSQLLSSTNEVHGCASVNLLGATAAIQGSVPLSVTDGPGGLTYRHNSKCYRTSSYFSTSINDEVTNLSPIQLTIQQQNQFGPTATSSKSSISVSQIITFQRYHFNIVDEYRAPYVHNTLAWTIEMESLSSSKPLSSLTHFSSAEDSGEHQTHHRHNTDHGIISMNRMNRVSLGLAWQLNRNVALKAVLYPPTSSSSTSSSNNGITATTALLLKRWYYPRITCSILHKWSLHDPTKNRIFPAAQFAGIGIDIETGDNNHYCSSSSTSNTTHRSTPKSTSYCNEDDEDNMGSPKLHPPTIAVLPKELYKLKQRR